MIGKRSTPVIGKLTGTCIPAGTVESVTSPRSPLDFKLQSPRGLKCYDCGGVGLAIVAALEKSGEIPAKKAVYNRNTSRSHPIPVISARLKTEFHETEHLVDSSSSFEEYTVVTCRAPGNKTYTRVYGDERSKINQSKKCSKQSVFDISPARFGDFPAYPDSDFLSCCHLCQKKLHGKDIYMYRGEKAFCSTECRYRQIVIDEHKEKCSSEAPRSVDIASSPYANGQIFSTGILAI